MDNDFTTADIGNEDTSRGPREKFLLVVVYNSSAAISWIHFFKHI